MKTMKQLAATLLLLTAAFGCQTNNQPEPQHGTYLVYTNLPAVQFDNLTIRINDKVIGMLSQPYQVNRSQTKPGCETESGPSVLRIQRPLGSYSLDAVATLKGKQTATWSTSLRFEAGDCKRANLIFED